LLVQPPALPPAPNSFRSNAGDAKCPPPVASAIFTPQLPKPTTSAFPSPFTSASMRGERSLPLHPPALPLAPNARSCSVGWAKCPLPVASATLTPKLPKPTTSAIPSPSTSPYAPLYRSLLIQPPALPPAPNALRSNVGYAKCPPPAASATFTPQLPKPTTS